MTKANDHRTKDFILEEQKAEADRVRITSATSLEIQRHLPGPIERVWQHLVHSELRSKWFCGGEVGQQSGDPIEFDFDHSRLTTTPPPPEHQDAGPVFFTGTIIAIQPPMFLQFEWPTTPGGSSSKVTIQLAKAGDGVNLRLRHERVEKADHLISAAAGWHTHLYLLEALLAGKETPDFWELHNQAETEYQSEHQATKDALDNLGRETEKGASRGAGASELQPSS